MDVYTGIDGALFAAYDQVVDVGLGLREGHAGGGDGTALALLEIERLLRLGQHVQTPRAHLAIGRYRYQTVRVLRAHNAEAVHGMRVGRGRERTALDGRPLGAAVVPQDDFARVGAAQDQVGVEAGEAARQDGRLAVEDVLGGRFLEAGVPHQAHAVRVVRRVFVVVVGGHQQLGELRRPVHARHAAVARPPLVEEAPRQVDLVPRTIVTTIQHE